MRVTSHTTVARGWGDHNDDLPNLWQDNFVTGAFPLVFSPVITCASRMCLCVFELRDAGESSDRVQHSGPAAVSRRRQLQDVPANTVVDLQRFQNDLAAITPGHEVQLFSTGVISRKFR